MTATIIQFNKKTKKLDTAQKVYSSLIDIFYDVYSEVIDEWQRNAVQNRLNDYIISVLPTYALGKKRADYINDLNVIADVEQKLSMKVAIFYPDTTLDNPLGWLVAFIYNNESFGAQPHMSSEANARALNIILYVKFLNTLQTITVNEEQT